ncbi:MAG: hypothetical protein WCB14_01105 [Candidatus Acidiferrales bacterium]
MGDLPPARIEKTTIGLESEPEDPLQKSKEKPKPKPAPQAIPEIAEQDEETHELDTLA